MSNGTKVEGMHETVTSKRLAALMTKGWLLWSEDG